MPTQRGPIYFLTGPPGIGKSTTARALANRFEKAVHLDIDDIRHLVVRGIALPIPGKWTDENTLQYNLAHAVAGQTAKIYSDAGFAVVAEHCSHVPYIESFKRKAGPTIVVSLIADLQQNLYRNSLRTSDSFDYKSLEFVIPMISKSFPKEHRKAKIPILDNTNLTVEEAVDRILKL